MSAWWHGLAPEWATLVIVAAILAGSTTINLALKRVLPPKLNEEIARRINAWWFMAAVFFGAVLAGRTAAIVLFAFVSFWGLKEFVTLLKTRAADHRTLVWTFLAVPIQYAWIGMGWYGMFVLFIPVYMFLWLPARLVLARETAGFVSSASQIQWGLMAFVFGLSHMAMLLQLNVPADAGYDGRTLLLFLVLVVELSDVLQFCWGKALGRHKIIPAVSPNKTWEGFLGGIGTVALVAVGLRYLTPFSAGEAAGIALLVGVAGFAGGAVMSAVKRDFGVKDFGKALPGHGGVLDRVDSLCYAAPVFFHVVRFFFATP